MTGFPKNFLWGASTASHQVEGGTVNQWSEWEPTHAEELAITARERLNWLDVWPQIKDEASDPANYISGRGVEHYKRYKEDFDILQSLNFNSFRFGIEWARLEPEEGEWDEEAVEHYRAYIRELKTRGVEPFLNIWHWTVPVWFEELGGFARKENLRHWERFVSKIAKEYAKDLTYILTLNEPNVFVSNSFINGQWPPQEKNWAKGLVIYNNLVRAHKSSYKILKAKKPKLQIGIAAHLTNIQPKNPSNLIDQASTKRMRYFWNWWFLNRIKDEQDFIGFNYYFTDYFKGFSRANPKLPVNDLGWYMEPEGLYPLLQKVWKHYKKPIYITENGVADMKDQYRRWWIEETIVAMEKAISDGVDLRGYFHWSLLDNFEWAYGWWPKFGLVEVDRKTMKRKMRPSAKWFAKQIGKQA